MFVRRIGRYIPLQFAGSTKKEREVESAHKRLGLDALRALGEVFKGGRGGKTKKLPLQGKIDHLFG